MEQEVSEGSSAISERQQTMLQTEWASFTFFFFLIEFIFCLSNLAEIGGINLSRKKKYQEKL